MKKGDDRRQQIIETAEALFYAKGYEATSIQDILDALDLSKGGFYHHFESKLALLTAICDIRADELSQDMEAAIDACEGNAVDKLNALFSKGGLLHESSMDFIGLLMQVAYRGDGVMLREKMKSATVRGALPLLNGIISEGVETKLFSTRYQDDIGEMLLLLFAVLTDEVSLILATTPERMSAVLAKLEVYRYTVETLLNAPYGSVLLYDIDRIAFVLKVIAEQDKKLGKLPER